MGCRQPDADDMRQSCGMDREQLLHTAEAALNGIRSNPAYTGLSSEAIGRMAWNDALELLRCADESEPDSERPGTY